MGSFVSFLRRNLFSIIVAVVTSLIISAELYIESAVYWTRAGISFAILLPLFVLISEKRLLQQAKNLLSEKKGWSRILEVLILPGMTCTVFVALLLFAQEIGLLPVNPFLICLGLFISVSAALAIRHLPFPGYCRIILMVLFYTVMILYFYYNHIRSGYIGWTQEGLDIFSPLAARVYPWLHIVGLLLLAAQFRLSPARALICIVVNIPLYFVFIDSGYMLISDFFTLVMLSNLAATPRTTAKVILGSLCSILVFVAIGFTTGWVTNKTVDFVYAGTGYSLGMGHPNLAALIVLSILLLVWHLWLNNHPIITAIISLPLAVAVYLVTYSRTGAICLILLSLLGFYKLFSLKKSSKTAFGLLILLPIIAAAFSIITIYAVPKYSFQEGQTFSLRFIYPYWLLKDHGLPIFGSTVIKQSDFIIDNLFCHLLIYYGIVSLILVIVLLSWTAWKYYKQEQYTELMMLGLFMVYSVIENALIYMPYGFTLLLLATKEQWHPRHNNKHLQTLQPSP
ncbi:MAG: hypothetical protein IJK71_00695 [Clostridia bacterium]|nr:hypothetical protein [Clostridia bacterium]